MQRLDVRIALGVVAALLVVFAAALVWRVGFGGPDGKEPVASAPPEPAEGQGASGAAADESEPAPEPATVLTATRSSSAVPGAATAADADAGGGWQGSYSRSAEADDAHPDAPAEEPDAESGDPFNSEPAPSRDEFAGFEDSPYGYGEPAADGGPEPAGADPFPAEHDLADHGAAAEPEETGFAAAPAARSGRNQLREGATAGAGNPLREPRGAQPAGRFADEHARGSRPGLSPDLEEPAERPSTSGSREAPGDDPLGAGGWSHSPTAGEDAAQPAAADARARELAASDPADYGADYGEDAAQLDSAAREATLPAARSAAGRAPRLLADSPTAAHASPGGAGKGSAREVVPTSAETAAAAAASRAGPAAAGTYRVAARDTYWRISRSVYGNPAYYRALYEHNRARLPRADRLPPGAVLETPDLATLERLYPQFCPAVGPN